MTLRAVTIRQPWAWAVAFGGKDIENRGGSWRLWHWPGPLCIHAGEAWSYRGFTDERVRRVWSRTHDGLDMRSAERVAGRWVHSSMADVRRGDAIEFGAVIAVARLVEAHPATEGCCSSPWAEWEYRDSRNEVTTNVVHLVLADVEPIDSVPVRGRLGPWPVPPEAAAEILAELA